jgi:hypothetical protein
MIGLSVKVVDKTKKIAMAVEKAAYRNVGHALASIMGDARRSIRRGKNSAAVGEPPRTRRGLMRRAIRFQIAQNKKSGVAGPRASIAGTSAKPHEHGGTYKGVHYEQRPFMEPALKRATPRFAGSFAGSIGE